MAEPITIQRTSAETLFEELQTNQRPVVINALKQEAYMAKRIPGSVNVPTEHADWVNQIVPDKEQDIVVYCASADCDASAQLAEALREQGYTHVRDFEEGIEGWKEAGYKLNGTETD